MDEQALVITTPDGADVDLTPLVTAAQGIRRNALQDAEHDRDTGAGKMGTAYTLMGMQIAVLHLFGEEAASLFQDQVEKIG